MAKRIKRSGLTLTAVGLGTKVANIRPEPADIILTNTGIDIKGSKIRFIGSQKNLLASFDSRTSRFTVKKSLIVDGIDILDKLKKLEARVKTLES